MPNDRLLSGLPAGATAVTPHRGAKAARVLLLLCVLITLGPGASSDASDFSRRQRRQGESGIASPAISARVVPVYVRASNGNGGEHTRCRDNIPGDCKFGNEDRFDDGKVDLGDRGGAALGGGALMACGGTEESACPDIRT